MWLVSCYMVNYVHQLLINIACLLFGAEQVAHSRPTTLMRA